MNAETKHTPKPWILRDRTGTIGNPAMQIEGPQGEVIARVIYQDGFGTLQANANLLIAAPDLLEACKQSERLITQIATVANNPDTFRFWPGGLREQVLDWLRNSPAWAAISKAEAQS